jgi:5-methylcytosine-specific restriction endonuclease McrA
VKLATAATCEYSGLMDRSHAKVKSVDTAIPIGKLVRAYLSEITFHCQHVNAAEFARLQDVVYCKDTFGLRLAFLKDVARFSHADKDRYWSPVIDIHNMQVRATNDWYERSRTPFLAYVQKLGIKEPSPIVGAVVASIPLNPPKRKVQDARFKGFPIGNAQNLLVRNVLARLGRETFTEANWKAVVASFGHQCAYCGGQDKLIREHVVPINKDALGEHRLGNLVPSCSACNVKKGEKDFRKFLASDPAKLAKIESHMAKHGYTPISNNTKVQAIIAQAHAEVREMADKYVLLLQDALGRP